MMSFTTADPINSVTMPLTLPLRTLVTTFFIT